jgi:hypothetical protein
LLQELDHMAAARDADGLEEGPGEGRPGLGAAAGDGGPVFVRGYGAVEMSYAAEEKDAA